MHYRDHVVGCTTHVRDTPMWWRYVIRWIRRAAKEGQPAVIKTSVLTVALLTLWISGYTGADDRDIYNRKAATRYVELFEWADRNRDKVVSRTEAKGSVDLEATFDDIDIDRDSYMTWLELERYVLAVFATRINQASR